MGLYDDRLDQLNESRSRVAARRKSSSTRVQSLLFSRDAGWTTSSAKSWAKANGYKHAKVDVTDQDVRIRQADPKQFKTKRTITFGRGIRAVVAKEKSGVKEMAKARRHKKKSPKRARRSRPRRKARATAAVAAPRRHKRRRKVHAVAAAPRRRRRRVAAVVATPRRRRRRVKAWRGNSAGHATAARKGHKRRKARGYRKRRRAAETTVAAPRRRRVRAKSRSYGMRAASPRRSRRMYASTGGSMTAGTMAMAAFTGTVGFIVADGLDRFMATYNPSSTEAAPKDKFTSSGAGTLANTMNIAATPTWKRIAVGVAAPVVPAVGAVFVKNKMGRAALEGFALGAGISTMKMLFNTLVIGRLLKPKDVSNASLQKSMVARLYPAEVSARVNIEQKLLAVSSSGSGALSGSRDPGPFATGDSPRYPDATQAARGVGDMPTAADAIRQRAGVSDMPTAADAMRGVGEGWEPGPTPGPGPGPQNSNDASCGCADRYGNFLGDQPQD